MLDFFQSSCSTRARLQIVIEQKHLLLQTFFLFFVLIRIHMLVCDWIVGKGVNTQIHPGGEPKNYPYKFGMQTNNFSQIQMMF